MKFQLFTQIALHEDIPEYGLKKVSIATIVEYYPMPEDREDGPGWVKSDMGGSSAQRSLAQGADTAIWLATQAPSKLTGKLFYDRREVLY